MSETPGEDRQLPDMPTSVVTCADVEDRDLAAAYLAGRLSEDDAAAYEAHYFGCEPCWAALRRATELRAAFAVPVRAGWRPAPWAVRLAATITLLVGGWLVVDRFRTPAPTLTMRGSADSLAILPSSRVGIFAASWRPVPGAASYRVRLFTADGGLLLERETADTLIEVPADSVALPAGVIRIFWQLQSLDALRQPVARSPLTPAVVPPAR